MRLTQKELFEVSARMGAAAAAHVPVLASPEISGELVCPAGELSLSHLRKRLAMMSPFKLQQMLAEKLASPWGGFVERWGSGQVPPLPASPASWESRVISCWEWGKLHPQGLLPQQLAAAGACARPLSWGMTVKLGKPWRSSGAELT